MRILYSQNNIAPFDIDRYKKSLQKYEDVPIEKIQEALKELHYDPMHYSVLIEVGANLIQDEEKAKAYYYDHRPDLPQFERLRRITGYLVGSLERWNDGKRAEERDRVKHNIKDEIEHKKYEQMIQRYEQI